MSNTINGPLQKILKGVLKYRQTVRANMVEQFKRIKDDPHPTAVFFTCMDSRMLATRFTQAQVGDMFMVRNAGNLIPHAANYGPFGTEVSVTTEPAAIELGCVRGGIKNVIVCGHSDCKAMNILFGLHENPASFNPNSPLEMWLRRNGHMSLEKYDCCVKHENKILEYMKDLPAYKFNAVIDPQNKLDPRDKLSQISCLQQLENIASHKVIQAQVEKGLLHLNAMWFDIYTGEVYMFNKTWGRFVLLDESSIDQLLKNVM